MPSPSSSRPTPRRLAPLAAGGDAAVAGRPIGDFLPVELPRNAAELPCRAVIRTASGDDVELSIDTCAAGYVVTWRVVAPPAATGALAQAGSLLDALPDGVALAAPADLRAIHLNQAARALLVRHAAAGDGDAAGAPLLPLLPEALRRLSLFADPGDLPANGRVQLGDEIFDVAVRPALGEGGRYLGPLFTWSNATQRVRLAGQFEEHVSAAVRLVSASSAEMRATAGALGHAAEETDQMSGSVAAASTEASANTQTVASATEELSAAIGEISRQVAEAGRVASDPAAPATISELEAALAAHAGWKRRLKRSAATRSSDIDVATARRDDCCAFGKWLHGQGRSLPAAIKGGDYDTVVALHRQFHVAAGDTLKHALDGDKAGYARMVDLTDGPFTLASGTLVGRLSGWRRRLRR